MLVAFITGITGQDGSFLAELLLEKNYHVWGMVRKSTTNTRMINIEHLLDNTNLKLRCGDMTDSSSMTNILREIKETYPNIEKLDVYNLAAVSHVAISFEIPQQTTSVNALGVLSLLDAIRFSGYKDKIRFYQASTSELYGDVQDTSKAQDETTPYNPQSPYAIAKLYANDLTLLYRKGYNMHNTIGLLNNHISYRRSPLFLDSKVCKGVADIYHGKMDKLYLGNVNSYRDFGYAKDYVKAMYLIMQYPTPEHWIISSQKTYQVREFVEKAFKIKGFNIQWKGEGIDEIGYDTNTGRELIFIDPSLFRPADVNFLLGDSSRARELLGWEEEYTIDQVIEEMVEYHCTH
jgi:GDPmannose 4,6-dehydratase